MKILLALIICLKSFTLFAKEETLSPGGALFSLTANEMVFASKLSDENRHTFCYKFSAKERIACIAKLDKETNLTSPDEIVVAMSEETSSE